LPPALLGGGEIVLPALLATGESWQRIVLNGKAYFHLYFLAILTQFSLVFPLLFVALRRMRLPFAALLGLTALLQGGVYVLQAKLSALAVSRLFDDLVCGPPVHRHVAGHEPGGLAAHLGALALADRAGDVGGPGAVSVVVVVPAEHGQLRPGGRDRACGQQRNSRHGLQRRPDHLCDRICRCYCWLSRSGLPLLWRQVAAARNGRVAASASSGRWREGWRGLAPTPCRCICCIRSCSMR
jgi:hypothetical protein